MLSEEKAIIEVRKLRDANKRNSLGKSIDTALNLIDRLQKGTEEKDKQIDLMLDEYEYNARINLKDYCDEELRKNTCIEDCKLCIKQYFERKSKE